MGRFRKESFFKGKGEAKRKKMETQVASVKKRLWDTFIWSSEETDAGTFLFKILISCNA